MIRIVGIERCEDPGREFVLLQNQGSMRVQLRGHVLLADAFIDGQDSCPAPFIFNEEVHIYPGAYVLLRTGVGESKWTVTRDGGRIFNCYMGKTGSHWIKLGQTLHLLSAHHSYTERPVVPCG